MSRGGRGRAVGVANGNFRSGAYYRYVQNITEPEPVIDPIDELISTMKTLNDIKRSNMSWARAESTKMVCPFCKFSFKNHKQEKDIAEQLRILTLIQWQAESEATRASDYPV